MKAIILAAGEGTRLGKYTKEMPKCMLKFNGKSLIEKQVGTLRRAGINNIIIIRGYKAEKIKIAGVKYYENKEYASTNMVATLMAARKEFGDEKITKNNLKSNDKSIIVCYSDIIYETRLIKKIMKAKYDVNVLVDDSWLEYWQERLDNWQDDVESLQYDKNNLIFELGTKTKNLSKAKSRYIGILKFSSYGLKKLIEVFDENKKLYWNNNVPWFNSKSFKKSYMTCMVQALINKGINVRAIRINHGWLEFDTVEDYEKTTSWLKQGKLDKYINIDN